MVHLYESSNNQKPSILNSIWNGVKSIGSDIGSMVSQVPEMIKAGVEKFSKDPVGAVFDIVVSPIKQVVSGFGEIGEAISHAIEGDWEAAGKSALSGVTNVIGGATSIAIVASTVLVAFNPVAAAVIAGYAMYGGIVESGLGLTQNIVGQMTNDSDYAKKGTMHLVSGAVKAFTAKGLQNLAKSRIEQASTISSKAEILKQNRINGKTAERLAVDKLKEQGYDIVNSQVSAQTSIGRRVIDHLVRDSSGNLIAVEVKSGNAIRNAMQLAKDALLESEGGLLVGKNAGDLAGEFLKLPTIEMRINW